jgi:hypothetical protein
MIIKYISTLTNKLHIFVELFHLIRLYLANGDVHAKESPSPFHIVH